MMYAILAANGGELVEQAIAGSLRTGGPFSPDRFRAYFRNVGGYRTIKQLTRVIQLVNMGVLADLAASRWAPPSGPSSLPMREVVLDDWARSPAGERALRHSNWTEPPDDMVVRFAPGTSLVEVKSAGAGVPVPGSAFLVLEDGRLTSTIESPEWSRFLACVDGKRTVAGILSLLQLTKNPLLRFLNAALDEGVLIEVEDTLRGAATAHYLPRAYSGSAVEPQTVTVLPQKFD